LRALNEASVIIKIHILKKFVLEDRYRERKKELLVIILAYNEEGAIERVVGNLRATWPQCNKVRVLHDKSIACVGVVPQLLFFFVQLFGLYDPANVLFAIIFPVHFYFNVPLSITSKLNEQVKRLAQLDALLEKEAREIEETNQK